MSRDLPSSCADLDLAKARRALIRTGGNVSAAARKLGVPIQDLRQLTHFVPGLLEAALEAEERALDRAEAQLMEALRHPNLSTRLEAARYLLRHSSGRAKRGF